MTAARLMVNALCSVLCALCSVLCALCSVLYAQCSMLYFIQWYISLEYLIQCPKVWKSWGSLSKNGFMLYALCSMLAEAHGSSQKPVEARGSPQKPAEARGSLRKPAEACRSIHINAYKRLMNAYASYYRSLLHIFRGGGWGWGGRGGSVEVSLCAACCCQKP